MPCSKCTRRSLVELPDANQWGPILWSLLHGISIKRTKIDSLKLMSLKVKWKLLFDTLPQIIPCVECKEHLVAYMSQNPYVTINSEEEFSNWFYLLHEDVNKRLNKPSLDKTKLVEIHSQVNLRTAYYKCDKLMELNIRAGEVSILAWSKMKTVILFLFSLYNI